MSEIGASDGAATDTESVPVGRPPSAARATTSIMEAVGDRSSPPESQGEPAPEPDSESERPGPAGLARRFPIGGSDDDCETARIRPESALDSKNPTRIGTRLNPDTDCDPNGGGGPAAA